MSDDEFASYVAARQRRLQQTAWLLTGDRAAAEDVVQDTLAKCWRHWRRVRTTGDPDAYVRRVLVNTFLSTRRRRWWREQPTERLSERELDGAPDVELRLTVQTALGRLPARQRSVVILRFFDDLSVEQTAEAMECAPGTVKSTTAKALARLRADADIAGLLEEVP